MIALWLHTPEYVEYIWIWWIDCLLSSRAAYSVYTRADVLENMFLDLPQKTNLMLVKPSVLSGWDATASRNKPSQFLFAKHWHIVWHLCDVESLVLVKTYIYNYKYIYIYVDIHKFWVLSHQSLCFVSVSGQSENCHRTALKDVYCFLLWIGPLLVATCCCGVNLVLHCFPFWEIVKLNPGIWVFAHRKESCDTSKLKASKLMGLG